MKKIQSLITVEMTNAELEDIWGICEIADLNSKKLLATETDPVKQLKIHEERKLVWEYMKKIEEMQETAIPCS